MSDSHLSSDRQWPHWPNFNQFKRQVKELLKSYRAGEAGAVAEVERHEQTPDPAAIALHDCATRAGKKLRLHELAETKELCPDDRELPPAAGTTV